MVAKLWANQIIKGNKIFWEVPTGLRDRVREILIEEGHGELAGL